MYASGGYRRTNFEGFNVYEVTAPAPAVKRGWYWELTSTYESAGPDTYDKAVEAGRARAKEVGKK